MFSIAVSLCACRHSNGDVFAGIKTTQLSMGINIAKVVLNKNYFKSVLLTVAKKYMIIAILPMTYLYHFTYAHLIHNLAP